MLYYTTKIDRMLMTVKGEMGEEVGRKMGSKKVMIVHLFWF